MQYKLINFCILILLTSFTISYGNQQMVCFPADTCHSIGVELYDQYKYVESLNYSKEAAKLRLKNNDKLLWKSYRNIGLAYFEMQLYNEAKKNFIKSYETIGKKTTIDSVLLLRNIGECYSEIGDFEEGRYYLRKAVKINPYEPEVNAIYAAVLNSSGDSIQTKEAIKYAETSIRLNKQMQNNGDDIDYLTRWMMPAISVKGNALNKLGRYNQALKFYENGLKLIPNPDLDFQADILNNIATILFEQKKYDLAIKKLNESLSLLLKYNETDYYYDYAGNYENLADNYSALQQFDTALLHYQKALINLTNNFRNQDIFQNPNPKDTFLYIYSNMDIIQVLHLKASTAFKYYKKNNKEKYLNLANQTYQTAFDFHDKLQKEISTENSRLFQVKNIAPYIENALKIAYELQKNGQSIGETAFRFMEKNKATVLLQSMNEADALQFSNLPDSLLEQEKNLKVAIAFHKKQLNEALEYEDTAEIDNLNNILFKEKKQYSKLINNLENNYTDYYQLKYKQNQIQLTDLQNTLDNKTALLEFFVGDSSIYILSIQKNQSKLHQTIKPENWEQAIQDFLNGVNPKGDKYGDALFNSFTQNAFFLYQKLLLQPLSSLNKSISNIKIIPDAELNYIPMELLLTNKVNAAEVDYTDLPYLIKEKTISYCYSVALLIENMTKTSQSYTYNYAGFAPDYKNTDYNLLTDANNNVQGTAELLNGQSYFKSEATETNFKDKIDLYKTFHLAMHGILDDEHPLNSKLIFTKTNNTNDNELQAYELYNMKIPAQLGVLSACNTGTGKHVKGEGIMSLSRAFTYAGCNSLVMSLWSIEDEATAGIVYSFFKYLKKGKTKDEALKQAKLDYLENTTLLKTHPIYWAGLVQSGDTSVIEFDTSYNWILKNLLLLIMALLLMGVLFFKLLN